MPVTLLILSSSKEYLNFIHLLKNVKSQITKLEALMNLIVFYFLGMYKNFISLLWKYTRFALEQ